MTRAGTLGGMALSLFALITMACGSASEEAGDATVASSTSADAATAPASVASSSTVPPSTTDAPDATITPTTEVSEVDEGPTATEPPTAEEMLATLTEAQIAQIGGIECATELAVIFAAGQRYIADRGIEPESLDDLYEGGYIDEPLVLWAMVDDSFEPIAGSGCIDLNAGAECIDETETLTVARLAYIEANSGGSEPTQADLAAGELILDESEIVDLVDGVVVAVPGGPCEGIDLTVDWAQSCLAGQRTMEVAYEAYMAQNPGGPEPTEADLAGEYIRYESPILDFDGSVVVATPGGPCEGIDFS